MNIGQHALQVLATKPSMSTERERPAYQKVKMRKSFIIKMAENGNTFPEIAKAINVGHATVMNYVADICGKSIDSKIRRNASIKTGRK